MNKRHGILSVLSLALIGVTLNAARASQSKTAEPAAHTVLQVKARGVVSGYKGKLQLLYVTERDGIRVKDKRGNYLKDGTKVLVYPYGSVYSIRYCENITNLCMSYNLQELAKGVHPVEFNGKLYLSIQAKGLDEAASTRVSVAFRSSLGDWRVMNLLATRMGSSATSYILELDENSGRQKFDEMEVSLNVIPLGMKRVILKSAQNVIADLDPSQLRPLK